MVFDDAMCSPSNWSVQGMPHECPSAADGDGDKSSSLHDPRDIESRVSITRKLPLAQGQL